MRKLTHVFYVYRRKGNTQQHFWQLYLYLVFICQSRVVVFLSAIYAIQVFETFCIFEKPVVNTSYNTTKWQPSNFSKK